MDAIALETIYGIDLSFDVRTGVQGSKDVVVNGQGNDFAYVSGVVALAQELQRLFDLTEPGSFVDDSGYGIEWPIGQSNDPRVTIALTKLAIVRAMGHPSFVGRCKLRYLDVQFSPQEPNALRVGGIVQCVGFEGSPLMSFDYLLRNYG